MKRHRTAGLTLVEVLVSLALFALIATAGLSVLDQVLRTQRQTEARLERLGALQRAMHLVGRDLAELDAGSVAGNVATLTLSRHSAADRATIGYALTDARLARQATLPDGTAATQSLLPDVTDLRWRYLDDAGQWHDTWPVVRPPAAPELRAVEMVMVLGPAGEQLRRLVAVPRTPAP